MIVARSTTTTTTPVIAAVLLLLLICQFVVFAVSAEDDGIAGSSSSAKEEGNEQQQQQGLHNMMKEMDGNSILPYFKPHVMENVEIIGERLRNGHVVVIRDAFMDDFANALHHDLDNNIPDNAWELNQWYGTSGFTYQHHNIYDGSHFTEFLNVTEQVFDHYETKQFMTELSGTNCLGDGLFSPSYYMPGDYSLPHADHHKKRSVGMIYHLSKHWKPEYGGALYWIPESYEHGYIHASYNTLILFIVRPDAAHFVTQVSPIAKEKRLAFNGWWQIEWDDDEDDEDYYDQQDIEEILRDPEKRRDMTVVEYEYIEEYLQQQQSSGEGENNDDDDELDTTEEWVEEMQELLALYDEEMFPALPKRTYTVKPPEMENNDDEADDENGQNVEEEDESSSEQQEKVLQEEEMMLLCPGHPTCIETAAKPT